jgi:uncharacterized protein (TIGR00369 family)
MTEGVPPASWAQSPLGRHLGIEGVLADDEHVLTRMAIEERHQNPQGAIHGGAIVSLADNTATAMANRANAGPDGSGPFMVAIDLHTVFLANQQGGFIEAEARVVRRGRRVTVIRTVVRGEGGRALAEVTTTHVPA